MSKINAQQKDPQNKHELINWSPMQLVECYSVCCFRSMKETYTYFYRINFEHSLPITI